MAIATLSREITVRSNNGTDKSLESWIWDAECSIRGAKEAAKYIATAENYHDLVSILGVPNGPGPAHPDSMR